ncbi:MAG: ribonuclease M5 [Firmicutes bacterium]|uniref:Ribonuclease M5 n=1 Tax=Candidatus Gallilactobacillus intestinavium TaxID=2840838 RepID=A0A9D9H836_9LACO|nr:ribonuclease M5 [Candidatus Gallilactobacillus intestinavium]
MKRIQEVIVVEGKNDTKKVKQAVIADTYETNGSHVTSQTISDLQKLQKERGLIILTDPDFNGERIRKIILKNVPDVKQAFINRKNTLPHGKNKHSVGIEHASITNIQQALENVITVNNKDNHDQIKIDDLINNNLINCPLSKKRRLALCEELNIGYVNGKQLLKRLNLFQITKKQFDRALDKINGKEDERNN